MKTYSLTEHLKAITVLPFMAVVVIPVLIQLTAPTWQAWSPLGMVSATTRIALGIVFLACGLQIFTWCAVAFQRIGKGTLAPWSPTRRLVVRGLYCHTRNPMILGVWLLLLAEALLLDSPPLLIWAIVFLVANHVYFILLEEPGLERRFGAEYIEYRREVPRWLPRLTAWKPSDELSHTSQGRPGRNRAAR